MVVVVVVLVVVVVVGGGGGVGILGEVKARPKDIISFSLDYISKSKVQTSNPSSSPIPLDTPARPADFFGYLHTFGRGCPPQYQASQSIKATQLVAVASTKPCWLSVRSRGGGGTSGCCGGFLRFQLLMILVASRVCNFRTLQVSMDIRLKLSCRSYVTIL